MKRFFVGALAAALSAVSVAATLNPVQLLNPAGSAAGQTIVSTSSSTAPGWGTIPLGGLSAIPANTVVANGTGAGATPVAFVMPSCSSAGNALEWSSGTGFICNSSMFSSPTITTPNITGVTNGSNAAAGSLGEYVTATGTAVSMASGTTLNVTSISLTAGDWIVSGSSALNPAGTTVYTNGSLAVSTVSVTSPAAPLYTFVGGLTYATGNAPTMIAPTQRINVSSTTTVFLVAQSVFTTSTMTITGTIWARRLH